VGSAHERAPRARSSSRARSIFTSPAARSRRRTSSACSPRARGVGDGARVQRHVPALDALGDEHPQRRQVRGEPDRRHDRGQLASARNAEHAERQPHARVRVHDGGHRRDGHGQLDRADQVLLEDACREGAPRVSVRERRVEPPGPPIRHVPYPGGESGRCADGAVPSAAGGGWPARGSPVRSARRVRGWETGSALARACGCARGAILQGRAAPGCGGAGPTGEPARRARRARRASG